MSSDEVQPIRTPTEEWISKLRELRLLRPSLAGKDGQPDPKYMFGFILIPLAYAIYALRFGTGIFDRDLATSLGNSVSVFGLAGYIVSAAGCAYHFLVLYCRVRVARETELPFIFEIADYDDSRKKTALSGEFKEKFSKWVAIVIKAMKVISHILMVKVEVDIFFFVVVSPIVQEGVSIRNILFWSIVSIWVFPVLYYVCLDWVYVFGSWYLCKMHFDMQTDFLNDQIEKMIEKIGRGAEVTGRDIINLNIYYRRLVTKVKIFDEFSKDLISPYRFIKSYTGPFAVFASHQSVNLIFTISMDSFVIGLDICAIGFLSTSCSLSIKRKRLYYAANCLFVKICEKQVSTSTESIQSKIILRRMIKSLGDDDCHTLCLSDKSGEEFDPMEFFEFLLDTFANFTLVTGLYNDYVRSHTKNVL